MPRLLASLVVLVLLLSSCTGGDAQPPPLTTADSSASTAATDPPAGDGAAAAEIPAPDFPAGLDWLNTDRPISLDQLRGKVVLLDFWTYGCINCIHVIPDLARLEEEYPDELVVIGVHSAKFENEAATENIRQVILRYGLEHPVVNDADFEIWRSYGAQAWPTLFLIDPAGNVVGWHAGEGVYDLFAPVLADLVAEFDARGEIDRTSLDLKLEREGLPETVLSFPGKVTVDGGRGRLFVTDTNHHRIVQASLDGEVQAVYGAGVSGYGDGPALEATFDQPQGTAVSADGAVLYVADTGNHVIRAIDLATGTVDTLTGTGRQAPWPPAGGPMPDTPLASPWDVEFDGDRLYIAMAGMHQIWMADLVAGTVGPFAGSGIEGTRNGTGEQAELAQPSGLSLAEDGRLFFADSESSAIRWVDTMAEDRSVGIAAGSDADLFDFGDVDGTGTESRLQHPLGVVAAGGTVWVADTYNSKLKAIDVPTLAVATFVGSEPGWRDGSDALFFEPGGVDYHAGTLYVADTNNHSIRLVDVDSGAVETLVLRGLEAFLPSAESDTFAGTVLELDPVEVAAGPGSVVLDVIIPDGYKVNPDAPSRFDWSVEGDGLVLSPGASGSVLGPSFPLSIPVTFDGEATLVGDISVVYCDVEAERICLIEQVRVEVPIRTVDGAGGTVQIVHEIVLPDL